ncbi:hypothetical protein A6V36_36570 [Paraburkholderia ginsengiterrae]|uniref:Uncharacterized protein n=1 Tax=Paraburkholderia ginsengiterrae TaxID=1462993 RepID=A0A1A9MXG6_9BURK|nr:hypothetical protein A6V37_36390 [Paraburkholderia ginsengiterrae]OAJ54138.1 hypothetical protein A6V36_36570 [Paraburkholderia ginsengiterrae]
MTSNGDRCLVQVRGVADRHNPKISCQLLCIRPKRDFFNTITEEETLTWANTGDREGSGAAGRAKQREVWNCSAMYLRISREIFVGSSSTTLIIRHDSIDLPRSKLAGASTGCSINRFVGRA